MWHVFLSSDRAETLQKFLVFFLTNWEGGGVEKIRKKFSITIDKGYPIVNNNVWASYPLCIFIFFSVPDKYCVEREDPRSESQDHSSSLNPVFNISRLLSPSHSLALAGWLICLCTNLVLLLSLLRRFVFYPIIFLFPFFYFFVSVFVFFEKTPRTRLDFCKTMENWNRREKNLIKFQWEKIWEKSLVDYLNWRRKNFFNFSFE